MLKSKRRKNPTEGSFLGGLAIGVGGGLLLSSKAASALFLKSTGGDKPPCLMATVAHPEGEPYFPNPQPGVNCNAGLGASQTSGINTPLYIAVGGIGLIGYLVGGGSGAIGAVIGVVGIAISKFTI